MQFSMSENMKRVAGAVFFVVLAGGYWWWEHRPEPVEKETVTEALVVVTKSTNSGATFSAGTVAATPTGYPTPTTRT